LTGGPYGNTLYAEMKAAHSYRPGGRVRAIGAVMASLLFHLGVVALGGAMLPEEKRHVARMEVDLRLVAPPDPEAEPEKRSALPPESEPEKKHRPELKRPEPAQRPQPEETTPGPEPEPHEEDEARAEESSSSYRKEDPYAPPSLSIDYREIIQRKIYEARRYPSRSIANEEEGVANVRFVIEADGSVDGVEVVSSSGYFLLDRAAVDAVRRAAPFPPLPTGFPFDRTTVSLAVGFRLRDIGY